MIELSYFYEHKTHIVESLRKRNIPQAEQMVEEVISLDQQRKEWQTKYDKLKAEMNRSAKKIGQLFQQGEKQKAEELKSEMGRVKETLKEWEEEQRVIKQKLEEALLDMPNVLHKLVPAGSSEEENEVVKDWVGDLPHVGKEAKPHWELASDLGILDMELGAKLTGSGFPVFLGKGARLQRALIHFFLDRAAEQGYLEVVPPLLVNETTARATGQLPDKEGQMYHITAENFYLIPTAEVPVTNLYRDQILEEAQFPIKLCGYTPCFRREAGSYGADVKGLNRVHQFDKVEIVQIQHPEQSYKTLDDMVSYVGSLLDELGLPYRILRLCGGDTGSVAAMTYDFEVYSAAQKKWLEVSSVSNFESYQANRLGLRYRTDKGTRLVHTLNGSALALARIIAAIIENGQDKGIIRIPKILIPYTGFELIE